MKLQPPDGGGSARVLVFDTECRPMHYSEWRQEGQITGWAYAWLDQPTMLRTGVLRHSETDAGYRANEIMLLSRLVRAIRHADVVVGHYIRRHDLPLINGHLLRLNCPLLGDVLTLDTKSDLPPLGQLGQSLENLGDHLGLAEGKHHMSGAAWFVANQLTREGREGTIKRVGDDVRLNVAVLQELQKRGALGTPQWWRP